MGQIYMIQNLINNKVYIGLTTRKFEYRYGKNGIKSVYGKQKHSNAHLSSSIEKYGLDCWEIKILHDNVTDIEELKNLEQYYVYKYKSNDPKYGYNKTAGGDAIADRLKKKVICINDQNIFDSLADAGEYYNISYTAISQCCLGKIQQVYGNQFAYYEEGKKYKLKEITNECFKQVICINTMEKFNTITSAATKYNVNIEAIRQACNNHYKGATASGYQWDYFEEGKEYELIDRTYYNSRRVICVNTGEIYESISEAEKVKNITGISACCRGQIYTAGGCQWEFYEDGNKYELKEIQYKMANRRKVICLETQKVYDSIVDAENETGATNISLVISKERETSGGMHWDYYNEGKEYRLEDYIKQRVFHNQQRVICINTGIIYESITQAQKETGVNNISAVCRGKFLTAGGMQWSYYEEGKEYKLKEPKLRKVKKSKVKLKESVMRSRKVICIDTGVIYDSLEEAAKEVDVSKGAISACCLGKSKTSAGMQWEYYNPNKIYTKKEIVNKDSGKPKKRVLCIETNIVYDSISDADKATGVSFKNISAVCRGKRGKAGGFTWKFIE